MSYEASSPEPRERRIRTFFRENSPSSSAAANSKKLDKLIDEIARDDHLTTEEKLVCFEKAASKIDIQVAKLQAERYANMDEATLWRTLIETKCVCSIRGLHVSDDKVGERFGLHDVAVPHGWHEYVGGGLKMCRCHEGYFAFDMGARHAMLVSETLAGVLKYFGDEDDQTEGNWRRYGSAYDKYAPDQWAEYYC